MACFLALPSLTPRSGNQLEFQDETYPAKQEERGYHMLKIS